MAQTHLDAREWLESLIRSSDPAADFAKEMLDELDLDEDNAELLEEWEDKIGDKDKAAAKLVELESLYAWAGRFELFDECYGGTLEDQLDIHFNQGEREVKLYISAGLYVGTQAEAKKLDDGTGFEQVEVPTDKEGLIAYINALRTKHARAEQAQPAVVDAEGVLHKEAPVALDALFEGAPVEYQLTLAVGAIDRAHAQIGQLKASQRGGIATPADTPSADDPEDDVDPFA